jgi:hypothetical protein
MKGRARECGLLEEIQFQLMEEGYLRSRTVRMTPAETLGGWSALWLKR